jgi:uncharacterized membrane protein
MNMAAAAEGFAATGLELAEAAVVVLVAAGRGHRRAALTGAALAAAVVTGAATPAGPRLLGLIPTERLRQLLGAGLTMVGVFWLVQSIVRPEATARELDHEATHARRRAQRGAVATALVAAKAVGLEGTEAAVLVLGIGTPQHALPAATGGATLAALAVTVLALLLAPRLHALASHILNRVAGTALALIGGFWLADGSHLPGAATFLLLAAISALVAVAWLLPVFTFRNSDTS